MKKKYEETDTSIKYNKRDLRNAKKDDVPVTIARGLSTVTLS